ncbi:MAG: hypothetical protein A2511_05415 [Deltaproteobacteria bacterium RIFOXYD12_FULL_50_9]|nr:MAG: hypothetical protein A2511_05415 [Deltaproteobacteria bacterium RIFOXYD12_FULL_50_9]
MRSSVSAIILAAGKGTRMKSDYAKVLHEVFYRPMIHHVLDAVQALALAKNIVVTGYKRQEVEKVLQGYDVVSAPQEEQLGTGHAVLAAEQFVARSKTATVLILCGDTPLIRPETLGRMLDEHCSGGAVLTVMTTLVADPTNYGRIVTDDQGRLLAIVEEKDATPEIRAIKEINAGIYCVSSDFLFNALLKVDRNNKQSEVYLTDIVAIAVNSDYQVSRFSCEDSLEVLGVNSRIELAEAHACLQNRRNRSLMLSGVTLLRPETIAIEHSVEIGRDTVIHPHVYIGGSSRIGSNCVIESFTQIKDSVIGSGATIGSHSSINNREIDEGLQIGPHTVYI